MNEARTRRGNNLGTWTWRVGWLLGVVGGVAGLVATVRFTQSYLARDYPRLAVSPDLITFEVLLARVDGFRALVVLASAFFLSAVLGLAAAIPVLRRVCSVLVLALGIVVTLLSILGGFSVGGYTLYAAIPVLAGGVMLVLAARSRRAWAK